MTGSMKIGVPKLVVYYQFTWGKIINFANQRAYTKKKIKYLTHSRHIKFFSEG